MRLIHAGIVLSIATLGFADTIVLKDGNAITGTYLGGTARQVRVDTGDSIQTLDVTDIKRIEFNTPTAKAAPAYREPEARPAIMRPEPRMTASRLGIRKAT